MAHLPLLLLSLLLIGVHASVSHGSPLPPTYNTSICSKSYKCGGVNISYPFYLSNATGETYDYTQFSCGYTDLKIFCSRDRPGRNETPTILLGGDNYTVLNIIYDSQTIVLADTDALRGGSCPRVRHNFTFGQAYEWLQYTGSPDNLTFFFGCKLNLAPPIVPGLVSVADQYQINCKTFSNGPDGGDSFVFTSGELEAPAESELARRCSQVIVVPVNGSILNSSNQSALPSGGYGQVLNKGFDLAWNSRKDDQCNKCEQSRGYCSYSQNRIFLGCLCSDGKVGSQSQDCRSASRDSSLERRKKLYIIAGTSSVLLLCLLYFACLFSLKKYRHRRISKGTPRIESFLQRNGTLHPKRYTYTEVKRMTKSFAEKLGHGGFGAVYKGNLSDGRQVAVKMLKDSKGDGEEFINEVASISRTSHVNVVSLLGFCLHRSKRALIYEYMPNGSLERYAFRKNSKGELSLTWEKLFDVAVGIARGLEYLHRGCSTRIVHFDIKPHNILLDQEFCPKISDFGMAKLCANKESIVSIAGARGTIGYIAPEVYSKQFGAITSKSDVYSYGMMILEMVGARERNIDANSESSSHYFPQWIYEHLDEYCISSSEIDGETTELVRKMVVVALWCIQVVPTNRPTMTRVVEMLEGSTGGLELPPKVLLSW
ncbi:LEAF RUST 10 DISEASE-RESISTANCE LOCUS RECEPTOR-LIKE PROTEIN KINASE-like 2.1 isoform X1 [Oryza glaberrima]|uniref:LEAF RUST 10 DISEASE-RESISTANCE LOCUS RECEPTOR-LIKE PROTEIN KINASE-like 2.1 isoform X1 n=1 Tax=Oryza glaberrima TaxID=4538 RepID=UPI00224BEA0C|nr:LEAF RUST 10 DISEASE-RESISTANCE LOCUS RECEPTOR-LIKE PROTEIN KINASE-like 2.1 isoform X1 [Oryza glaberrima]